MHYICPSILRGGAVVARWAHNPKVGGSNPSSATKKKPCCDSNRALLFSDSQKLAFIRDGNNKANSHAMRGKAFSLLSEKFHSPLILCRVF